MPLTAVFVSFPDIHIETEVGDVMFFFFFFTVRKGIVYGKVRVGDVAIAPVLISITRLKMHENAMDRVRGRDTQRVAGVFVWVSGSIGGVVE